MKRVLSLVVALMIMATLFAGCGKSNDQASNGGSSDGKTDDKSPITFTMFSEDPNTNYEDMQSAVGKKITEKTGVTLKIEYPVGDPKQKISLMAASGEYPDIVYAKGDSNIIVDAKGFVDLSKYIDQNGPNIKKLYGDYLKRLRWSLDDKAMYTLGAYGVNQQQWAPGGDVFNVQHAVVKDEGYPQLKTLTDVENAIKTYKDKNPTIDGQPTIGLSMIAEDWRMLCSVTNAAISVSGGSDDGEWYVDQNTKKPVYHFTRPEAKEYFQWLNHMNDIGLLDPEAFVQKYDQYQAKISSGRVLAITDAKWEYNQAEQALRQAGKEDRMYGQYGVSLNANYKPADFMSGGYSAGWGVGISTSAKDPARVVRFIDFLASDEGQVLNNWGIEGVNYTVKDGKRVISDEEWAKRNSDPQYGKKTGVGVYGYPFPQQGDGVVDPTGNTYTPNSKDQIVKNYTATEKDVLSHYNATMWMDLFPKTEEFPIKPYGAAWQINIPQDTDTAVTFTKAEDIMKKMVPKAVLAKPAEFEGVWTDFMNQLDAAGVHKMEDEFSKLLQNKIKLWND